jgi:uncharacterized protein YndB with AHSA1/START domain/effector-binding domain-containing protein
MPKLELRTDGDRHVIVTRRFAAPPEAVYRAHTEPALIQKWMLGPAGWTMPVCIIDARPGGKFRYEWANGNGASFSITGECIELTPYTRLVHVERMHLPDPTPDNHVETTFAPDGDGGTLMTLRMTLPDAKTRAAMLATGMEHGMEDSYVRLERICAHEQAGAGQEGQFRLHGTPDIITTTPQLTATLRLNIPRNEMMKRFGPALQEVLAALRAQGIAPTGSAFAHHFKMTPGVFDFELGFVTPTPIQPAGQVHPGHWPAQRCAHATYVGPYEGLATARGEFDKWMTSNALPQADDLWEHYATGPHSSPDPTTWRTELYRPLRD